MGTSPCGNPRWESALIRLGRGPSLGKKSRHCPPLSQSPSAFRHFEPIVYVLPRLELKIPYLAKETKMLTQSRLARAAALALSASAAFLFLPQATRAGERPADDPSPLTLENQPQYLDENLPSLAPSAPRSLNTSRAPLMGLLDGAGIAPTLDDARINIFGHAEVGYTYNFDRPAKDLNLGRVFDVNNDDVQMNQLDLNIERKLDLKAGQWDVGGRVEFLYGTDARFIHSSGFFDYGQGSAASSNSKSVAPGPEYQFDIPQIYADLGIPIGNGLRLRAGKFLFFKQIDPNASVFYSHSFTFGAALPFTLTGTTLYYPISDQLSVEGGISRGWGQTLKDNNGAIDGLGRIRYSSEDHKTDISLALISGPELDHDNTHYRTVVDATLTTQVTDHLTLLFDGVYGYQALAGGTNSAWYGVSAYAVCSLNDYLTVNGRGEWYRDEEGFTTGIHQTLYEATLGLTLTPFPTNDLGRNLKIRPEVRYDYSNRHFFDGLSRHDQTTFAIDAYFDF